MTNQDTANRAPHMLGQLLLGMAAGYSTLAVYAFTAWVL